MGAKLRLGLAALLAVGVALAAVFVAAGGAAGGKTAIVVVAKSGVNLGGQGSDYAEYGLVLRNRSTMDALNVGVTVEALDSQGGAFTTDYPVITVIPAGTSFVVDGQLIWGVSINLARIRAIVHVGKIASRGRTLPRVTHVALANGGNDITASLTNTYKKPLPSNATVYGVFLDSRGRVIAAGDQTTGATIQPGQTVSVDLFANLSTTAQLAAVSSARVSVDPCGIDAGTSTCPVPGASG